MKKILFLNILFFSYSIWGSVYDTLPMGISTVVFKQVATNKIESKYDSSSSNKKLLISENFTSSKLNEISDSVKTFFDELKNLSPEAYDSFSMGQFEAEAWAQVNAQGIGIGYGLTNNLTLYGTLPIYHIKTNVNFYQTKPNNLEKVRESLSKITPTTASGTFVKQLIMQFPDANESLLQSVIVNHYKYKPLGLWESDSLGDIELGSIYRFTNEKNRGLGLSMGLVLPTGRKDDPDNLQDIATGDGQADLFIEPLAGISFYEKMVLFDLKVRYTFQFANPRTVRTYEDPNTPFSIDSQKLDEKLGNKIDITLSNTINPNEWLNVNLSYIYNYTGKTKYDFENTKIKNALEDGTESENHWGKLGLGFSTIELYRKKKFEMPLEINLSAQKLINAKNTADYGRYDLEFRFYY